ncbi:flavodoxin family protein [Clostridium botulinum]|uniref:Flavodoxin family protein n=1 Tax=Clostridium botulinum TaxID=1491 RepID=A0A6B4JJZ7_CLOBO|nr:NAD(P)H-dependent oxidoreductase [Clostridium botulinum]EES49169.1 flavin reductase [Clostridium botulinum E1 str. 'BoNT E Beluga']MBY6760270.1 flavodoxin family protein [Clostridium botulinum]MBY6919177.1 flavodoxin family protein [Clostridium botulinum]MCR1130054.1 flavodoxin family protein [Clostridium botulinum]NFJ57181.1 flavodoxin family protein [Clostridium botulinum]
MSEKWIAIVGSPRKGKNTDLMVDYVIEGLNEKNIGVDKFFLSSSNISTCTGCESCIKTGVCIIKDDVSKIIDDMKNADGYIFASPSYNYNMTAQMKAFLDRTFCLNDYNDGWKSRLSPNKKAIIIGVCAGKTKESMGYTVEGMSKLISELDIKIIDEIEYYNTKYIPVANNDKIREKVIEIVRNYRNFYLI